MIQTTVDAPAEWWPGMMADVAAAVGRRAAAVREDVYEVILREIPQLRKDKPLLLDAIKAQLNRDLRPGKYILAGSTRYATLPEAAQA